MSEKTQAKSKTLILNIDRDGDVERKTHWRSPVVGRGNVLKLAQTLLLSDPEEADGNAIFASIKIYDELAGREGLDKLIAVISGGVKRGFEADRKIISELRQILREFPADNVIIVTDGFSDEQIIPIIGSHVRISSIQRVVVRQSESVEETYALFLRYFKMAWENSTYRMYLVGLPGIALIISGLLLIFNLIELAFKAILILVGGVMVIKGFRIDEYIASLKIAPIAELLKLFSVIASIISIASGVYLSYLNVSALPEFSEVLRNRVLFLSYGAYLTGHFLKSFLPVFTTGILVYLLGISFYNIMIEADKLFRKVILSTLTIVFFFIGSEVAEVLINPARGVSTLIIYILIGVSFIFIVSLLSYLLSKRREG